MKKTPPAHQVIIPESQRRCAMKKPLTFAGVQRELLALRKMAQARGMFVFQDAMTLSPSCHPTEGLTARVFAGEKFLRLCCRRCKAPVGEISIARWRV